MAAEFPSDLKFKRSFRLCAKKKQIKRRTYIKNHKEKENFFSVYILNRNFVHFVILPLCSNRFPRIPGTKFL